MNEIAALDATAQAALVRSGEASPVELVEAAVASIERHDPSVNAVIHRFFDEARDAASRASSGPFRGVPLLFKDLGACPAGLPLHAGNRVLTERDARASRSSYLARALERAGFVTLGKTNTPEFGLQPTTQPSTRGPTRNPWALNRSTAGSSGGSAAAVASGMVAVAHANDGGGSIRLPAAWCGLPGLRPSRGRIGIGATASRNHVEFVLTRTMRDLAGVLDAVVGQGPEDLFVAPDPTGPYRDLLRGPVAPLRVGLVTATPLGPVHPACVRAAESVATSLAALGHRVEPVELPVLGGTPHLVDYRTTAMAGLRARIREVARVAGVPAHPELVEPYTWAMAGRDRDTSAVAFIEADARVVAWGEEFLAPWRTPVGRTQNTVDLIVTPSTMDPSRRLAELVPDPDRPLALYETFQRIWHFALPANISGQPALTVPTFDDELQRPVGAQILADRYREDLLIAVGAALEAAGGWPATPVRPRVGL